VCQDSIFRLDRQNIGNLDPVSVLPGQVHGLIRGLAVWRYSLQEAGGFGDHLDRLVIGESDAIVGRLPSIRAGRKDYGGLLQLHQD